MNGEIVPLKIDFDFGTGGDAIYLALLRDKAATCWSTADTADSCRA